MRGRQGEAAWIVLLAAALAGCPGGEAGDDDDAAGDDDTSAGDDDTGPSFQEVHGALFLGKWTYATGDLHEPHAASAQFFDPVAEGEPMVVDEVDPQDGLDDCGLTYTDTSTGSGMEYEAREVGAAFVEIPGQEFQLPSVGNGFYTLYLTDAGFDAAYGQVYSFRAEPGDFPGFQYESGIEFPEALAISEPAVAHGVIPPGDVTFRWTGGGDELWLRLVGDDGAGQAIDVLCRVEDDGEFTVPADLAAALPQGAMVVATRLNTDWLEVEPDVYLAVTALNEHYGWFTWGD